MTHHTEGKDMFKIGTKVRSKPNAFTRVTGWVTAIHEPREGQVCAYAAVYVGGYQSVLVPVDDLVELT